MQTPFQCETEDDLYESIANQEVKFPPRVGKDAAKLVKGVSDALCVCECDMCAAAEQYVKKQLGAKGMKDLQHHSLFKGTRWDDMEAQTVPPPYVPSLTGVLILCVLLCE